MSMNKYGKVNEKIGQLPDVVKNPLEGVENVIELKT